MSVLLTPCLWGRSPLLVKLSVQRALWSEKSARSTVTISLTEGGPILPASPLHLSPAEKPGFVLVYLFQQCDRNKKCVRECCCFNHVELYATPRTGARQAPLSMGFFRQEYSSWFPLPSPGDLSKPGTESTSPAFPALQTNSFTTEPLRRDSDHVSEKLCLKRRILAFDFFCSEQCHFLEAIFRTMVIFPL